LNVHINRETQKRLTIAKEEIRDLFAKTSMLLKDSYRFASKVKGLCLTEFDARLQEEAVAIVSLVCKGELELAYLLKGSAVEGAICIFQSRSFGQGVFPAESTLANAA
jgi:hypothetical protein